MTYCRKCARILDEDVKQCPYCGSVEEQAETVDIDGLAGARTNGLNTGPGIDPVRELDQLFGKTDDAPEIPVTQTAEIAEITDTPHTPEVEVIDAQPYRQSYQTAGDPVVSEAILSLGAKILIMIGCLLLPPAGIVAAIIFMCKKERSYKSFGNILLVVMIMEMVIGCMCCCSAILQSVPYANF